MTAKEYLQQARALVEKGWCQGAYYINEDGTRASMRREAAAYCMMGAIERCGHIEALKTAKLKEEKGAPFFSGSGFWSNPDFLAVINLLQNETMESDGQGTTVCSGIIMWNDDPARTKEEVLAAFDAAIAKAE